MMLHTNDPLEPEQRKYTTIWAEPAYHQMSPGLEHIGLFVEMCEPKSGDSLIDIGCGSGVSGLEFERRGFNVTWLDLVNVLREDVPRHRFIKSSIFADWPALNKYGYDFGYCCDVMEHLSTEWTMLGAQQIINACRTSFFSIAHLPDRHGALIGETLHLTVQPFTWWRDRLALLGDLVEARDLCGRGIFLVRQWTSQHSTSRK